MIITTIATGSAGNCYLVEDNNHYVVLDCGIRFREITSHPKFPSFRDIDFVFSSHKHLDHSRSLEDFKRSGCEIVSYETLENKVQNLHIAGWDIITFKVNHNVDNWGIVIRHNKKEENLCYITDSFAFPKIENVTHWLLEVDYIEEMIDDIIDSEQDYKLKHNGFVNHNSLENAVSYFKSLKTRPKTITLCHLSADNSNAKKILKTMSQFADKVTIARKE